MTARRLDRVLRIRARAEREQAQALGRAMRDEREKTAEADAASERLEACVRQVAEALGGAPRAGMLSNLALTIRAAARALEDRHEAVQEAAANVEGEQQRWMERRRDRRAIEKLTERRAEEDRAREGRAEQSVLDAFEHHRRSTGGGRP
jgi:flagellar export protein FliJ